MYALTIVRAGPKGGVEIITQRFHTAGGASEVGSFIKQTLGDVVRVFLVDDETEGLSGLKRMTPVEITTEFAAANLAAARANKGE